MRVLMRPQRFLLWQRRNNTVAPFNETVQQVFARVSALRDSLDGPQGHNFLLSCLLLDCCVLHLVCPCHAANCVGLERSCMSCMQGHNIYDALRLM